LVFLSEYYDLEVYYQMYSQFQIVFPSSYKMIFFYNSVTKIFLFVISSFLHLGSPNLQIQIRIPSLPIYYYHIFYSPSLISQLMYYYPYCEYRWVSIYDFIRIQSIHRLLLIVYLSLYHIIHYYFIWILKEEMLPSQV
jgi:hypothetical protein